jgi:hypothetical protein
MQGFAAFCVPVRNHEKFDTYRNTKESFDTLFTQSSEFLMYLECMRTRVRKVKPKWRKLTSSANPFLLFVTARVTRSCRERDYGLII